MFIQAEEHPFFKGMILFFYEPGLSLEKFKHRYELAKGMFDEMVFLNYIVRIIY